MNNRQQLLSRLIETVDTSWDLRSWDEKEKKEVVKKVKRQSLRYPLSGNVSAQNVEAAASRWLR